MAYFWRKIPVIRTLTMRLGAKPLDERMPSDLPQNATTPDIEVQIDAAMIVAEARVRMDRDLDAERIFRPRHWAYGFVEEEAKPDHSRLPRDVSFGMLRAYYYWHDVGEPMRAETYINQAVTFVGAYAHLAHPAVAPEMAYHLARHKKNPQAARVQLRHGSAETSVRHIQRRAEAAILLAEGNLDMALIATREAKILLSLSDPEVAILEREWLDVLMDEIYAKLSTNHSQG